MFSTETWLAPYNYSIKVLKIDSLFYIDKQSYKVHIFINVLRTATLSFMVLYISQSDQKPQRLLGVTMQYIQASRPHFQTAHQQEELKIN